jgi:hypothetical protein
VATRAPGPVVSYLLALATTMMIAGITVVAFAQKEGSAANSFGGRFLGRNFCRFLADYTGKSLLDKTIVP